MIAFGFLVLLIGIFVLINTLNGNLPGLVDIPGVHDATVAIRGLMDTTKKTTVGSTPAITGSAVGNVGNVTGSAIGGVFGLIPGAVNDVENAIKNINKGVTPINSTSGGVSATGGSGRPVR